MGRKVSSAASLSAQCMQCIVALTLDPRASNGKHSRGEACAIDGSFTELIDLETACDGKHQAGTDPARWNSTNAAAIARN